MNNSSLFFVFLSLSPKERRDFELFVRSPYINRRDEVSRLYEFMVENITISESALTKEKAWKYVFPNEKYDDKKMRYTMSFLLQALRQFLIYREVEEDLVQSQVLLCRSLRQRRLSKLFESEIHKTMELQEKQPYRNTLYHYNNYKIQFESYEYISQHRRSGDMPLQQLSDELTYFYIADILRQSCTILTHQTISTRNYDLKFLNEVLKHVEENDYSFAPAILIYYYSYKALSNLDNEAHFQEFKKLLYKHWHLFPPVECQDLYILATNYCIKRLNKGDNKYIREGFDLYKSGLENDVFLEDGYLANFNYKNISRLGLALGEYDWVENFLNQYKKKLYPDTRENTYLYNLAFFYFQKPEYDKAMVLLQKVDFDDALNNLDARRMLLRIYYELGEFEPLHSLLDSFKTYISRQKDIGYHKDNYLNLIRIVKKMLRSDLSNPKTRGALITEINNTEALAERAWLLQQLKE